MLIDLLDCATVLDLKLAIAAERAHCAVPRLRLLILHNHSSASSSSSSSVAAESPEFTLLHNDRTLNSYGIRPDSNVEIDMFVRDVNACQGEFVRFHYRIDGRPIRGVAIHATTSEVYTLYAGSKVLVHDEHGTLLRSFDVQQLSLEAIAVAPSGDLFISCRDVDVNAPIVAVFDGIDGALKCTFGQDYDTHLLSSAWGVALSDTSGHVFVVDMDEHKIVVFTQQGEFVRAWGDEGTSPGQLRAPWGITVHDATVYVTDGTDRIQAFTEDGVLVRAFHAAAPDDGRKHTDTNSEQCDDCSSSSSDSSTRGCEPAGIAVLSNGDLLVCDYLGARVALFEPDGALMRTWQLRPIDDDEDENAPIYIAVAPSGAVFVSDGGSSVQVFQ